MAYAGNIPFETTAQQLKALFEGCTVTKVRLHTDRHTGQFKGFAHVHFADEASLDRYACSAEPLDRECKLMPLTSS